MIIKYFKDYISYISEGLSKTNDPKKILDLTLKRISNCDVSGYISVSNGCNKIIINISNVNRFTFEGLTKLFDELSESIVFVGGFFVSSIEIENFHKSKSIVKSDLYEIISNKNYYINLKLVFECKFDKVELNIPSKLYHLTIKEYESKILKYGLHPKEKSKLTNHPDRIYFSSNIKGCEDLKDSMRIYYEMERDYNMYSLLKKKYKKNISPVILEIDNSDGVIKNLYIDPNYTKGYFTIDNIPPDKIKVVR